jgi:ubiquitin-conjugating enzyme E2 M
MMDDGDDSKGVVEKGPELGSTVPPGANPVTQKLLDLRTASAIRFARDLDELSLSKFTADASTRISFPHGKKNARLVEVLLTPHAGLYQNASFRFSIAIPLQYPFKPPRLRCQTPVIHPNIDWRTGKVFLHLLENEWKPVLSINAVILAMQLMFVEPWPHPSSSLSLHTSAASDPVPPGVTLQGPIARACTRSAVFNGAMQLSDEAVLNPEIRSLLQLPTGKTMFQNMVEQTLRGGFFFGSQWSSNPSMHRQPVAEPSPARKPSSARIRVIRKGQGQWTPVGSTLPKGEALYCTRVTRSPDNTYSELRAPCVPAAAYGGRPAKRHHDNLTEKKEEEEEDKATNSAVTANSIIDTAAAFAVATASDPDSHDDRETRPKKSRACIDSLVLIPSLPATLAGSHRTVRVRADALEPPCASAAASAAASSSSSSVSTVAPSTGRKRRSDSVQADNEPPSTQVLELSDRIKVQRHVRFAKFPPCMSGLDRLSEAQAPPDRSLFSPRAILKPLPLYPAVGLMNLRDLGASLD